MLTACGSLLKGALHDFLDELFSQTACGSLAETCRISIKNNILYQYH